MNFNLSLGKFFGIPISIHWSWWIILALQIFLSSQFVGILIAMFVIVLLHELGHCFAARYFGFKIHHVYLHIMGGVAIAEMPNPTPKQEFWVVLCGPLVNLVLVLPLYLLSSLSTFMGILFLLNLGMLVFNLVPAFPLDGAKICRSIVFWVTGNEVFATTLFTSLTRVIAIAMGVVWFATVISGTTIAFIAMWFPLLALMLWASANYEIDRLALKREQQQSKELTN